MYQRANVFEAASRPLDDQACLLGQQISNEEIARRESAGKVLAAAVDNGVVYEMCARHHRGLVRTWGPDEVTAAVTSMLVHYALGGPGREGHLDPSRFADGNSSAAGWIGKVVGSMRTTRILREMRASTRELGSPLELENVSLPSAEDVVLGGAVPDVEDSTRGLPSTSATIRLVHASALHQLLGLPPLRPWKLTWAYGFGLLSALEDSPGTALRALAGNAEGIDDSIAESIRQLWAGWSRNDVAAMLALSTPERDIPRVLANAALRPLPRPAARSGDLERLRARAEDGVPAPAAAAVSTAFAAFLDCQVEVHTDFDRIRRQPTGIETARREASRETFPALLREAAQQIGIDYLDLLSGLNALFIDPLPVADPVYFTPTSWRFRA